MSPSEFWLRRLRVVRTGRPAYDQTFHLGVNIIRGENGSGKSTIADFIFYILGGEFENWKSAASECDEVQAEVVTSKGTLSLRRDIGRAQSPVHVFFGTMDEAAKHGIDGWQTYPLRRSGNSESFSQIMFRAAGIPEAQSQGASNITMHQMLRLMYSDQRTPAPFLFRYENFDTREIREAVGDLICGLSVYELYETELQLRELDKQFQEKDRRWSALLEGMPREEALVRVEVIDQQVASLTVEQQRLAQEIASVDNLVPDEHVTEFISGRRAAAESLRALSERMASVEEAAHVNEFELSDLKRFLEYLEDLSSKLPRTEAASEIIGTIEFTHCPACLAELQSRQDDLHCVLCGTEIDPEKAKSRYLQIRLDIETQIRETRQLISTREADDDELARELRSLRREHQAELSEYSVKYEVSTSPRQSFVAQRYQRIGQIDRERSELGRLRERALEMQSLSDEKARLQDEITKLSDRKRSLEAASKARRAHALTRISETAKSVLKQDLERQPEFHRAKSVTLNFGDNSILVDGELNFAESSNVVVKNAAILSVLLAACEDPGFFHPRFALFDNIEDKGMEMARSHNFQEIIVRMSEAATLSHQIIVTTSMPNPSLNEETLVVGPHYTHDVRTLDLAGTANAQPASTSRRD